MENSFKHGINNNSAYGSDSFKNSEDHMEFIDEGCESDQRDYSLSRVPPCFVLSDRSLIEKINDNQLQEGAREVIFSTSKSKNKSCLESNSTSDSVFFNDMLDSDFSDIEDTDGETFFNKLDLLNLNNSSHIMSPSFEKSHSLPHQRISTPRKRKYSSSSCEVERRLYAMLQSDPDEDGDIEENYLDTVWSSANQTLYPQCGLVFKGAETPSSHICPHDNYQLIEEVPTMSIKSTYMPPTLTNKADLNQIPTNYSSDFFSSFKHQPEHTFKGDSYNNARLIGIDHDFNNNHLQATPVQPLPTYNPSINPPPFHLEGKETYRDKLLEGMEQAQARCQSTKTHKKTHNNTTYNDNKSQHNNHVYPNTHKTDSNTTNITHQTTPYDGNIDDNNGFYNDSKHGAFKNDFNRLENNLVQSNFTEVGSSVDVKGGRDEGDEVGKKVVGNGRVVGHGWDESGDDGAKEKMTQNGGVKDGAKNKKVSRNNHELKKIRIQDDELLKKENLINEQKTTLAYTNKETFRGDAKKEQTNKNSNKSSKQPTEKTTIPPQTNSKYLDTNNTKFTKLKVKIKSAKTNSNMAEKSAYLSFSSDEGVITSPMLSPQNNKTSSPQQQQQHRSKKQKRMKKMKTEVYGSDGDSVDGLKKRSDKDMKDWRRPSSNFDEILWRPAISMGIIILTGIIIFYFKDKIPFMLSSKFPYHKSSI